MNFQHMFDVTQEGVEFIYLS